MIYCQKSDCKHYFEDSCILSYEKEHWKHIIVEIDCDGIGKCRKFEKGQNDGYKEGYYGK